MAETIGAVEDVLAATHTVLVVDWPSRDVPDSLARAGLEVLVRGGPGPDEYSRYEVVDSEVVVHHDGRVPDRADLVYSYRPLEELPAITALARQLGASAVWIQSGAAGDGTRDATGCFLTPDEAQRARRIVESAGLRYIDAPYIVDAVHGRA